MGQEQSELVDESEPSRTLKKRSLAALAKYIKDGKAAKIVVMVSLLAPSCIRLPHTRPVAVGIQRVFELLTSHYR